MISQSTIAAQVAEVRENAELFLFDTGYIKRYVDKATIRGETTLIYEDPVAVKCRMISRSGADNIPVASQFRAIQQKTNIALQRVQLPYDTEVTVHDIFIFNDHEFTILYVPEKHSLMAAFIIFVERRS